MLKLKDLKEFLIKRLPRRRHLRGSMLHRAVGERLFQNDIWKMSRHSVAAGLAVGTLIALTPTIGVQMFFAGIAAYFLRVNVPAALVVCWVTNPVTAPVIYPLQYKLGIWLLSIFNIHRVVHRGIFGHLVQYAWPLWIGSLVSGLVTAVILYWAVFLTWDWIMLLKAKLDQGLHNIHGEIGQKLHRKDDKELKKILKEGD